MRPSPLPSAPAGRAVRSSTVLAAVLVVIWVLAWGALTWANVLSGLLVVGVLLAALPDLRRGGAPVVVRPVPLARLVLHYLGDVVVANAQLVREVVRRRPRIRTAIVQVPLAGCTPDTLTLLAHLVAMTPGQMPVEVEHDPPVMYVHVLRFTSRDAVRHQIWALRDRVLDAFGTPDARAAAVAERGALAPGDEGSSGPGAEGGP